MAENRNTLTNEIWKPIKGWRDRYEVSNHGRVRSLDHVVPRKGQSPIIRKGRFLSQHLNHGYFQVTLCDGIKQRSISVARLVCEAWHGEPFAKAHAGHRNGNKTDNRPENLSWLTCQQNAEDRAAHGTQVREDTHPRRKINSSIARQIKERLARKQSQQSIANELGTTRGIVCGIALGVTWINA